MKIGTIGSIYRYPVKGMRGEQIPHAYAGFAGLLGDRVYGVIADDGDPAFPWHTARDHEEFVLYQARYRDDEKVSIPENLDDFEGLAPGIKPVDPEQDAYKVDVTTPEGDVFDVESQEFLDHLEDAAERKLRVHFTQKGQQDCRPLSLFSNSAVRALGEETGMDLDKRRFRANFYVDWDDPKDPYYELSLVGKTIRIGDRVRVAVIENDVRCKMITLDPETAEESPKLLRHVGRHHNGDAGVWAAVLQEGMVHEGDEILLE